MAKQVIISTPQGNTNGTPLDAAFAMCNDNFTELYNGAGGSAPESSPNSVLIGQGTGSPSLDSSLTTKSYIQIPMSDGLPSEGGGAKGPGAMYFELGTTSGIAPGLYISNSNRLFEKVTTGSSDPLNPIVVDPNASR